MLTYSMMTETWNTFRPISFLTRLPLQMTTYSPAIISTMTIQ